MKDINEHSDRSEKVDELICPTCALNAFRGIEPVRADDEDGSNPTENRIDVQMPLPI